jgi:hypothetical protein
MKLMRFFPGLLVCFACSGGEGGEGVGGAGGTIVLGFGGANGGARATYGGNVAFGGKSSGTGGAGLGGSTAAGGAIGTLGGAKSFGGASGGSESFGGAASSGSAGASAGGVPGATSEGLSPYTTECHGKSVDCADPALRCLGIRDATSVFGYSCSNPCKTASDCSSVDSGAEASAGCVPFTTESHCLLICQDESGERGCPNGMSCYVYPGTTVGYCLWR